MCQLACLSAFSRSLRLLTGVLTLGPAPSDRCGAFTLRPSVAQPVFTRKDTDRFFQWRIRNLPYPAENYDISIDHADGKVVIRTKNKK